MNEKYTLSSLFQYLAEDSLKQKKISNLLKACLKLLTENRAHISEKDMCSNHTKNIYSQITCALNKLNKKPKTAKSIAYLTE